jgi:exodeoxyribonuclease VII small subunit
MVNSENFEKLKAELETEIAWFESDKVSIEEAPVHYKNAKELLNKLEEILKTTKVKIEKLK